MAWERSGCHSVRVNNVTSHPLRLCIRLKLSSDWKLYLPVCQFAIRLYCVYYELYLIYQFSTLLMINLYVKCFEKNVYIYQGEPLIKSCDLIKKSRYSYKTVFIFNFRNNTQTELIPFPIPFWFQIESMMILIFKLWTKTKDTCIFYAVLIPMCCLWLFCMVPTVRQLSFFAVVWNFKQTKKTHGTKWE